MSGILNGGTISYIFILVHDFPGMFSFYHDILGFDAPYFEEGHFAFLKLGNTGPAIAMYAGRTTPVTDESHWFIVIDVADIDEVAERLRERGIAVGAIEDVPYGRAAIFRDPEGNAIEVHEPARG